MECAAATDLFLQSVKFHERYTEVISDCDSNMILHLNEIKLFSERVTIIKHKCVGHIRKSVGMQLRTVTAGSDHILIGTVTFYYMRFLCEGNQQGQNNSL